MKYIKIYRADNYYNNMGEIIGFFETKEDAEAWLDFSSPTNTAEGNFSQITEFQIEESAMRGVELKNTAGMLDEDIWGSSDIINDFYYVKQ